MKNVSYYLFSHNALYTFIGGVIDLVKKVDSDELGVTVFLKNTESTCEKFEYALQRDLVNPFTQLLFEADQKRDNRFLGFKGYVAIGKYHESEAWNKAAAEIEVLIDRYGGDLYKMAVAEETAVLDNLISDLNAEPYATAIRTIQGKEWMDFMVLANQEYKDLSLQRSELNNTNTNTLGDSRKPAVNAVKSLLSMISLLNQATANPVLSTLIEQLDNHIAKSMASARLSYSLNEKEEISEEK
ncbi:DUF6261 family protein [Labilibaculum euxinus]|uniref:Uncharacterized protein n=1 Tax=Labilibaculum euxinus TaxID=2686357 RepID=A0A7M4D948_9BACT|nr:DUF6261 family protein [Labilibaculum euxinus]MUP39177.1 hypothetical protein [Labilibaculum euxinus]MVB08382.1 hypothetical protein [Labilibaculum euxinus]